jgi:hypothetical protein
VPPFVTVLAGAPSGYTGREGASEFARSQEIVVMKAANVRSTAVGGGNVAADLAWGFIQLAWHIVRLPILAFLIIIEPVVRLVLWSAAFLGTLTAFLFEFSGAAPNFPFWLMISVSIGCMLLLGAYYALLRFFS